MDQLMNQSRACPGFLTGARPKGRRLRARMGFLGRGRNPSPSARGSGERCELHDGVRRGALTAHRFSTIFSTQDGISWHYNIVNSGLSCSHWGQDPRGPVAYPPGRLSCVRTLTVSTGPTLYMAKRSVEAMLTRAWPAGSEEWKRVVDMNSATAFIRDALPPTQTNYNIRTATITSSSSSSSSSYICISSLFVCLSVCLSLSSKLRSHWRLVEVTVGNVSDNKWQKKRQARMTLTRPWHQRTCVEGHGWRC